MSVQAMSWVIEHSPHGGSDLLCLLMIANHAHADGSGAFPAMATLARECRMSERQVIRIVHRLEAAGALLVERGTGRGHTHLLTVVVDPEAPRKTDKMSPITTERVTSGVVKPDILSPIQAERVTSRALKGDIAMSPEPLEPSLLLTPAVADAMDGAFGALADRGYARDDRFLSALSRTYPSLDLELEAIKIAEWLTEPRNRKRRCSKKFIDNWLKRAEADRAERGRAALQAVAVALPGPNGAAANGVYHPPAAFQRNPNPDAELPKWDADQAQRSDAERERIKAELRARPRRVPA